MSSDMSADGDNHVTDRDAADWESDDSGIRYAGMHYESDAVAMEHEYEDADLDLHVNQGKEVFLVAADDETDDWRSVYLSMDPDEAELLGEQLKLAAEYARDEEKADIRL